MVNHPHGYLRIFSLITGSEQACRASKDLELGTPGTFEGATASGTLRREQMIWPPQTTGIEV